MQCPLTANAQSTVKEKSLHICLYNRFICLCNRYICSCTSYISVKPKVIKFSSFFLLYPARRQSTASRMTKLLQMGNFENFISTHPGVNSWLPWCGHTTYLCFVEINLSCVEKFRIGRKKWILFFRNSLEWSSSARKLVSLNKTFADVFFVSVFLRSVPSFAHLLSFTSLFNDKKKSKHVSKSRRLCVCLGWDWFWLISEC